jgi:hypothetical protein
MKHFLSHVGYVIALVVMTGATTGDPIETSFQARIHAALEQTGGNKTKAAEIVGLSREALQAKIAQNPDLRRRWFNVEADNTPPIDEIDALTRDPISADQDRIAAAYEAESKKFRANLALLPLKPNEIEMALNLQKLNQGNFKELLDIANASMGMTIPKLLTQLQSIEARLDIVRKELLGMGGDMTEERVYLAEEEKSLCDQYLQTVETLRRIQTASFDGAKTLAVIRYRLKNGGSQKKDKPGYQAIDV